MTLSRYGPAKPRVKLPDTFRGSKDLHRIVRIQSAGEQGQATGVSTLTSCGNACPDGDSEGYADEMCNNGMMVVSVFTRYVPTVGSEISGRLAMQQGYADRPTVERIDSSRSKVEIVSPLLKKRKKNRGISFR